ncbi:prepilin-type N-terminal cleavage/methylation domain-containing protein [Thalassotalea sp. LPB0316]|uniref:prepilin-type N-terminal cleavage/methylation domain-containing protein n=1 Tax=Thalassotalea sp. LPB0316 TaxID=2769490 RepID=UPI001868C433|nr:prepilin-type N-terminal cleavage/methylation domain-containing protein [Thalassotalea sp. LPB0316]QOL26753.1 prepilin-type N-terminal cleavage/methylation domain-containing protein [Thalassotalea sp. LPB0316]
MRYSKRERGFTLVEIIIGIVVISLSFSIISTLVLPATEQSADQVQQIKAAELGQSLLTEILGKAYDEQPGVSGGIYRCNDNGQPNCSLTLGPEAGESRNNYNDVDDYDEITQLAGENIQNALGENLGDYYLGFVVDVSVVYDGDFNGVDDYLESGSSNQLAKLVTVEITTPSNQVISFSGYRTNY